MDFPDRTSLTNVAVLIETAPAGREIYVQPLKRSGHPTGPVLNLLQRKARPAPPPMLSGRQIIHYGQPEIAQVLSALSPSCGCFDLKPIVAHLPGLESSVSLRDLARRQGIPKTLIMASKVEPKARIKLVQKIWTSLVLPSLAHLEAGQIETIEPRSVETISISSEGFPLPAPLIPDLAPPKGGWRTTSWGEGEARECGLRFADGASLETLSSLTRRSPRAIHARLFLEGFITRD